MCPAPEWLPSSQGPPPPNGAPQEPPSLEGEKLSVFAVPRRLFLVLGVLSAIAWVTVLGLFGSNYVKIVYINYTRIVPSFFTAENCMGGIASTVAIVTSLSGAATTTTGAFTRAHSTAWAAQTMLALGLGGAATGGHVFLGGLATYELVVRVCALVLLAFLLPCAATFRPDRLALVDPSRRVPLALPPMLLAAVLLILDISALFLFARTPAVPTFHVVSLLAATACLCATLASAWGVLAYALRRLAAPLVLLVALSYTLLASGLSIAAMNVRHLSAFQYFEMALQACLLLALFAQFLATFFHPEELTWISCLQVSMPIELQHKYGAAFAFARLDESKQCAICMGDFENAVQGGCAHMFCRECITKWLEEHNTCPLCRAPLLVEELAQTVPWPDEGVELTSLSLAKDKARTTFPLANPPPTSVPPAGNGSPASEPKEEENEHLEEIDTSARLLDNA